MKEFLSFYSTNSLSRSNLNYENGNIKNIHYGDIHTKFPSIINCETEEIPYINLDIDSSRIKEDSFCKDSDLIIADASENYDDIGKAIELINVGNQKIVAGLHTILARDTADITVSGFKGYLFQTDNLKKQIKIITNGISVLGISKNNLKNLYVNIPSKEEQEKIVRFLFLIDRKIDLLEKTLVLYQKYIDNLSTILFSFVNIKKFKTVDEIFYTISSNKYQIKTKEIKNQGKVQVIDQSAHLIAGYSDDTEKICKETPLICFGDHTTNIKFIEHDFIVGGDGVKLLKPKIVSDIKYLYYALKEVNVNQEGYKRHYSILKNVEVPLCPLKDQKKISNILTLFDKKYNYYSIQLNYLKNFKRGLLQKMFC